MTEQVEVDLYKERIISVCEIVRSPQGAIPR